MAAAVACSQAATAHDVIASISGTSAALGFQYFSVFEATNANHRVTLEPVLGKTHESWLDYYRAADLAAIDLRLRRGRMSSRDFFCSEILRDDPDVTAGERDFFEQARRFDIADSYVLPYRSAGGRVFAAVLIGRGREITPELRVWVRTLSHEFLLAALRVKTEQTLRSPAAVRLTPREVQCLALVRDGASSADIAAQLSISLRTVDHYIGDACTKLGVRG